MNIITPRISIVIPVKNGMDTLPQAIAGIQKQTLFSECEVVIVDSGSTDGSVAFLEQFPFVRVIPIDPKSFNHGATRNLGVQHTKGEFVIMTVQDAVASDENWVENMLRHFDDECVSGVSGQQIVPHHPEKNPHQWYRPQSKPSFKTVHFSDKHEFDALLPHDQRSVCGWDDVNAMYRKSKMEEIPFETVSFGEDMLWAKTALRNGHKLVYDHSSKVNHYHFQFPDYTYRRVLITKVFIYKCFGYIASQKYSYKSYLLVVYRNFKWKCHPKWILHNFNIIFNHRKATQEFLNAVNSNNIDSLEKRLSLNVPLGKQNIKKHELTK